MDVRGWRKWFRTSASSTAGPHAPNKEVGMLKLLLGHWKSHRKKPSLLPEDGDIRFEEPSRINPLFEDSDESTTSSKSPSELTPQNHTPGLSRVLNEETQNQTDDPVVNDLIDVSVPKITSDNLETAVQQTDTDIAAANSNTITEATEGISSETNLKPVSEIAESVPEKTNQKTVLKEIEATTVTDPEETQINDAGKNTGSASIKTQSDSGNVKDESTLNDQQSSRLEQLSNEKAVTNSPPEDNTKVAEIKSVDSMRIFEQPSISAIKHTKLSSDEAASEKITSQSSELKSSKIQTLNKSGNVQKQPENINGKNERNNTVSKTTKLNEKNSFSKPVQSNQERVDVEKPAKLRARAIDELIKKFQGSTTDSVTDKSSSDKKSLLNSPTEKSDASANVAKTEKKPLPNKSEESIKETNKTLISQKNDITVTKPIQPNTSKKSEIEKEALSNIFKFPPPPPIDKLQNESSLHGKIVKERKPAEIVASSNVLTNGGDNSKETEASKTRSDSSLDRTRTASSNKLETITEKKSSHSDTNNKAKDSLNKQPIERLNSDNKKSRTKDLVTEQTSAKESKIEKETSQSKHLPEQKASTSGVDNVKSNPESVLNKTETKPPTGGLFVKKESVVSDSEPKPPPPQENSSNLHKKPASMDQKKASDFPAAKKKSSLSNKFPRDLLNNESENVRSHSEDSGITRGDQISSETTQEAAPVSGGPAEEVATPAQNPARRSRKDKKPRSAGKKPCKNCKRSHEEGSASVKKSQYDAYYDGLAGIRHKRRHSDSMNSDLSWEEKELIRRLRSKRGCTVRSNTPSTRSRNSRRRFVDEDHFRRHHHFRRSSDESSFYGAASLCSCDDCWVAYVKDYAYTRASLRGMPPIHQEMCTCRSSRHNFLGRRVKFRSDTIEEASPTETSTPAENKQEEADDGSSRQSSSGTKDDDSVLRHPAGIKEEKKAKFPDESSYRFVSPWELEEWDLVMRKELLKRRRRRARCMGVMALAMVVFVGLVVAILMVYLRRKII